MRSFAKTILIAAFLAVVVLVAPLVAQVDVLTRRGDNLRSGVYAQETILTHATVGTRFGKLWTLFADKTTSKILIARVAPRHCPVCALLARSWSTSPGQ